MTIKAEDLDTGSHVSLAKLLVLLNFETSTSNARRVIEQGGVNVGLDRTPIKEPTARIQVESGLIVRVGKRRIVQIRISERG